jgi:hypothetical protein
MRRRMACHGCVMVADYRECFEAQKRPQEWAARRKLLREPVTQRREPSSIPSSAGRAPEVSPPPAMVAGFTCSRGRWPKNARSIALRQSWADA